MAVSISKVHGMAVENQMDIDTEESQDDSAQFGLENLRLGPDSTMSSSHPEQTIFDRRQQAQRERNENYRNNNQLQNSRMPRARPTSVSDAEWEYQMLVHGMRNLPATHASRPAPVITNAPNRARLDQQDINIQHEFEARLRNGESWETAIQDFGQPAIVSDRGFRGVQLMNYIEEQVRDGLDFRTAFQNGLNRYFPPLSDEDPDSVMSADSVFGI